MPQKPQFLTFFTHFCWPFLVCKSGQLARKSGQKCIFSFLAIFLIFSQKTSKIVFWPEKVAICPFLKTKVATKITSKLGQIEGLLTRFDSRYGTQQARKYRILSLAIYESLPLLWSQYSLLPHMQSGHNILIHFVLSLCRSCLIALSYSNLISNCSKELKWFYCYVIQRQGSNH